MCGISGIICQSADEMVDRRVLSAMNDTLRHRGPDGDGEMVFPGAGLAHRRLSIIDLEGGLQPMQSGPFSITFNGEIYNFQDIRHELEGLGHQFKTRSDTEVLLQAFIEWGEGCVDRLRGMFAFAIWDRNARRLTLVRDRLGIKPVYYTRIPGGDFIFGSELKALLAHPGVSRRVNFDAMEDYLALSFVPDPKSIIRGVHKLAPGHMLTFQQGEAEPTIKRYWRPPSSPKRTLTDYADLIPRLEDAIKARLVSDVPIGAFLSGGLDSSAVVALMSQMIDGRLITATIGSDDPDQDESAYATQIADMFDTQHRLRLVNPRDTSLLTMLIDCFDEPFADNSALPTYRVCGLARERVTVALSGDGGDELFGGYRRHRFHVAEEKVRSRIPSGVRRSVFGALGKVYPKADWAPQMFRAKSTFESLSRDSASAYFHSVARGVDRDRRPLMSKHFKSMLGDYHPAQRFQELAEEVPDLTPFGLAQYIDMHMFLPGDILTKVDRTSMAHSLEVRVPLLDHEFVTWAMQLNEDLCVDPYEGKKPFKQALRQVLPDSVIDRPKQGFSVPMGQWLRTDLRDMVAGLADSDALADSGLFEQGGLKTMVEEHLNGVRNHESMLWSLLILDRNLTKLGLDCSR